MASSEPDVERLLSLKTATPIAQLNPDLVDQVGRKIHGEITITWPYSSVTKTFAFLLAEPDFRLRRDKGLVRIQLKGPSAEAVGQWELGSGDEVTLALDGVEWAKDEEPARPAGSRSEWQLRFAGKLMLKAILGENQETRTVHIDQPIPIDVPEATKPIPFAEIDLTLFDPPALDKASTLPDPPADDEFAAPVFIKRSRASYDPLFELDLDDELEDDGGRKGKGRKRPRYSAMNGIWTLHEGNGSPEPEQHQDPPSTSREQTEDVEMHMTPDRPAMADGGVQTNEFDLGPIPSSPGITPSKTWSGIDPSLSSNVRGPPSHDASRTDSGVQASTSRLAAAAPTERPVEAISQAAASPFGQTSQSSGFAEFGLSQGLPHNHEIGNAPLLFGTASTASSSQGLGGSSSLVGTAPNGLSTQAFGQAYSPFGDASNVPANQGLGQASSLFGLGSAQAQSPFSQVANSNTGSGATSGSLRFGFGQEPHSTFGASPFGTTQAPVQQPAASYPETSLDQNEPSNDLPSSPHNPCSPEAEHSLDTHGLKAPLEQTVSMDQTPEKGVPLWPMGTQTFDAIHVVGHINAAEELRSDGSDPEGTPPGIIPPAVEDGTRNADEMRHEGLLSQPVFRQDVPQEALPDQEDASAGEDDGSMDSDDQANYDDAEKGDDYDLRNYDRVSDDEDGFEEEDPLSDDELLDDRSEHWVEAASGYEDGDYDEDEEENEEDDTYSQGPRLFTQPQFPPQPAVQKQKIVIDLLSDSDEDELPAPPVKAPTSQLPLHEAASLPKTDTADVFKDESVDEQGGRVAQIEPPLPSGDSAHQDSGADQGGDESAEEGQDVEHEDEDDGIHEEHAEDEDELEPDDLLAESDDEEVEAEFQEANMVDRADETYEQPESFDGAMDVDDDNPPDNLADEEADEAHSNEPTTVNELNSMDRQLDSDSGDNIMAVDRDEPGNPTESFQTQPDEMLASFQTQVAGATSHSQSSESHGTSDVGMEDDIGQEVIRSEGNEEPRKIALESDLAEENLTKDGSEQLPRADAESLDLASEEEEVTVAVEKVAEVGVQEAPRADVSGNHGQVELSSPPTLQHQEDSAPAAPAVDLSTTTITSQVNMQLSNQQQVTLETQETYTKAQGVFSQPAEQGIDRNTGTGIESIVEETDVKMTDAEGAAEEEGDVKEVGVPQPPLDHDSEQRGEVQGFTPLEVTQGPLKEEIGSASPPRVTADSLSGQAPDEKPRMLAQAQDSHSEGDEDFHEALEMTDQARISPVTNPGDSFVSMDSQGSETHDAEEVETAPTGKTKRVGRKTRNALSAKSAKSAKSAPASQKAQRQSSRQSSRQVSAQQALSSQRTTRSKTMSFHTASPTEDKEDMSIQLARAALKSPTSKKRKVSATAAKRLNTDLIKRLENDLPDCVSLNDLRKYNANLVDVAAVATSANVPPKRTPTREYASSFTITDPSFATDGVVEIDLYSLHKDYLPVVKTGDSVLLRRFVVVSLAGRGFGLRTKDESAWAVFKAEGNDEPEMKAATVEMSDKETTFMLDLRAWYASLEDATKGKLVEAVEEMVETGKENKAKK